MNREKKGKQSVGRISRARVRKQAEEHPWMTASKSAWKHRGLLNRERKAAVSGGTMEQRAFADWSEIDLFL